MDNLSQSPVHLGKLSSQESIIKRQLTLYAIVRLVPWLVHQMFQVNQARKVCHNYLEGSVQNSFETLLKGMIGIYKTSLTATLITFSIPAPISASAALLLRLITSVFDIPATGYAAYRYGYRVLTKSFS